MPFYNKYLVAQKLNHGSNSCIILSYFITEKIHTVNDIKNIIKSVNDVNAG